MSRTSAFLATVVAFFIAEIGDKAQIATVALAAAYSNLLAVVAGTTAGMLQGNNARFSSKQKQKDLFPEGNPIARRQ